MPRQPAPEFNSPLSSDQDFENTLLPATLDDLDRDALQGFLAPRYASSARPEQAAESAASAGSDREIARRLSAVGLGAGQGNAWRPTVAAILLFGSAPEIFLPQIQVKLARFRGSDVSGLIIDRAELGGSVAPLIEGVVQFVSRNMRISGPIDSVYRRDTPEYPPRAIREAITNAVAHRDYRLNGQKVLVRMFDDRLEVESPGGLAGPVTLDTIELRRYSRNPRLAQGMYTLGLAEEMGTGIRRIRSELAQLGSSAPQFSSDPYSFMITLPALQIEAQAAPVVEVSPASSEDAAKARRAGWLRQGISPRQAGGLEYAVQNGRVTNREFRDLFPEISDEAARLDLVDLVERGLLMKIGSNRGTYYVLRD